MNDFDKIIVLDFGSQYNQLITRRIRDMHVFSALYPYNISALQIKEMKNVKGIIFSGGPSSIYDSDAPICDKEIFSLGIPILGICYGMQLIARENNAEVKEGKIKEYGKQEITIDTNSLLFSNLDEKQVVWMSHGDEVISIPEGFKKIASSANCKFAALSNEEKNIYCMQFHPEVRNSINGIKMLENFAYNICNARRSWEIENVIEEKILNIKEKVQSEKVLLGASGGVDSTVAAVLINKAIKDNLTCMFIDNGLLRKNEAEMVVKNFNKFNIKVIKIDAKEKFMKALKNVFDPEEKRKIVGRVFVEVFEEESKKLGNYKFLAQGTLYTDVIESGTKTAKTIKSHHNVGGLPDDMRFILLEPFNDLFKDEVRQIGISLGIDESLVYRQPFPGPGLSIRVKGEVTEEKLRIVRESDYILQEEIRNAHLEKEIWQYFTVLPNVKTVGVMGDNRTYCDVVVIRAVTSIDGMTCDWAKIPYEVLDIVSRRIINEVNGCNRVVYDITAKPPGTIEWE